MEIKYKTKKIQRVCTDYSAAKKSYGQNMAVKIEQRIGEISASDSVETMVVCGIGRCHALSGNRKGQYAVDLIHPFRLVFNVDGAEVYDIAIIEHIVDYH